MKKIQVLSWILVTALATTQLVACGSSSSPSLTPESTTSGGSGASGTSPAVTSSVSLPDKKITIGLQVPAARFDPLQFPQEAIGGRSMGEMVYEPLLMSDGFGEVYPWLAESYEVNDDATEWIFHLREGVTFSNGEPMTAADVVCTFDRLLANYSGMPASSYIQSIFPDNLFVSAEQVDDYTVKINLAYTFAISLLSFTDVMIIPDEAYAERGDDLFLDQSATGYYGTGPWVLQGHIIGQSANYKKNTNYWNKNYDSYYDEVEFLFITEQSTAIAACISGNIQAYCPSGGIRQDLISQFDSVRDKYDLYVTPQKSFFYVQLCTEAGKAFNDQKVRQAFLMSIDYESIIQYVFGGGTVMSQLIPDGFEGFNSDLPPYEYNPDEAKRLLQTLLVVLVVTVIAFSLMRLAPGNPARLMLRDDASEADIAAMEVYLGLDKPIYVQYWRYISALFQGDLGTSFSYQSPVSKLIGERIGYTIRLAVLTTIFAVSLCVPLGIIAGSHRGKPADFIAMFFALVGQSMSPVWLAVLLVYIFSVRLGWLPAVGSEGIIAFLLPAVTLGYPMAAELSRVGRSGMIDALGEDYIKATYAKGVSKLVVNWKYAFRNAVCPIITLVGMSMSLHLAGSIVVESIFALPGIGQLMYRAINMRDYPIVQSLLVIMAIIFALMNLAVDIINSIVDPRISLED
jgi:ABC-type dipeptide/oligopeptide/nickel transport system permease component